MKLTDGEILELNALCGAVVDGTLTDAQRARLGEWLRASEAARRFYVRALGQSASLHTYAAEIHVDAPDRRPAPDRVIYWRAWSVAALAAAAALIFALWRRPAPPSAAAAPIAIIKRGDDFVASVTAVKDAEWAASPLAPGTHLRKGQQLELRSGVAEITFDSGARIVLQGAAALDVNSAWDATLRHGALKASVPPEAIGFRVSNAAVDVVDLGTEFTMLADAAGAADVLVLKGEVEAAPRAVTTDDTILLREREARRFDDTGVSEVSDSAAKFARFDQPLALERFSPGLRCVHWSFDEAEPARAAAEIFGGGFGAADVTLAIFDRAAGAEGRVDGYRGRALRFDGRMYARASVPGISGGAPRTVTFWVRVPVDAQPIDTWMVAWSTTSPQLGGRPVQISWNRRPAEGALGALRTDFGGGYAIGTTSLRDGKWHHIAVFFAPPDPSGASPLVKQYVDGRLESSTIVPGTVRAPGGSGEMATRDVVWLGYRLTGKQEGRRFRGELDELFIADRGLDPNEIVGVMRDNRPPDISLVVAP